MEQKEMALAKRQNISRPFFQAQNEIQESILQRRRELLAKKVLSEADYEKYSKLLRPFERTAEDPHMRTRWADQQLEPEHGLFLQYSRSWPGICLLCQKGQRPFQCLIALRLIIPQLLLQVCQQLAVLVR